MPVRVNCPHCRAAQQLSEQMIGRQVNCPKCKKTFSVSGPAPPAGRLVGPGQPARLAPATAGNDFNFSAPSGGSSTARRPTKGVGGLCLVGCLLLACLFVILLSAASIVGWWLLARQGAETIMPGAEHAAIGPQAREYL
jgi:hypothetical protein